MDLMWGYSSDLDDADQDATRWLRDLAASTKASGLKGVLRLNEVASQSHAKLLLWDGDRGFETCIGSFNWLSAIADGDLTAGDRVSNVSVRISEPAIVSRICRRAAVLWDTVRAEAASGTGDRWRQVATELEAGTASHSRSELIAPNAKMSIVADRDHEYLLRRELSTAQSRLVVVSHKLGAIALTRMVSAKEHTRDPGFILNVMYGEATIDSDGVSRLTQLVVEAGGVVKQVPQLHAKVLLSDNALCVSSYNFLSADPFGTAKELRELGIRIVGSEPAQWVADRLAAL